MISATRVQYKLGTGELLHELGTSSMQLPFLVPMFDNRSSLLGIPSNVVIFLVLAALSVGTFFLVRRLFPVEREPRSFRATDRAEATGVLTRALAVSLALLAALVAFVLVAR